MYTYMYIYVYTVRNRLVRVTQDTHKRLGVCIHTEKTDFLESVAVQGGYCSIQAG